MDEFWRTTAQLQRAVNTAKQLAIRAGQPQITPEYLLLGIVSWPNVATDLLQHLHVDPDTVRAAVDALPASDDSVSHIKQIGAEVCTLSSAAYQVLAYAKEEARQDGGAITILDGLVGIIQSDGTQAGRVLASVGATDDTVRDYHELDMVLEMLNDDDDSIREEALELFHRYISRTSDQLAHNSLTGEAAIDARNDAYVQVLQDERIVEALLIQIEDSDDLVRSSAAGYLGNVLTPAAQDALIRHLRLDPAPHVRSTCAMELRWPPNAPNKIKALIEALEDPEATVVFGACSSLAETGDAKVAEPLRRVLSHADWNVRFTAAEGLLSLSAVDDSVVSVLEELVVQPEAAQSDHAAQDAYQVAVLVDKMHGIDREREPPRTVEYVLEVARASIRS